MLTVATCNSNVNMLNLHFQGRYRDAREMIDIALNMAFSGTSIMVVLLLIFVYNHKIFTKLVVPSLFLSSSVFSSQ